MTDTPTSSPLLDQITDSIASLLAETIATLEHLEDMRHQLSVSLAAAGGIIVHNVKCIAYLSDSYPDLPIVRIRHHDDATYWTLSTPKEVERVREKGASIECHGLPGGIEPCPPTERAPNG